MNTIKYKIKKFLNNVKNFSFEQNGQNEQNGLTRLNVQNRQTSQTRLYKISSGVSEDKNEMSEWGFGSLGNHGIYVGADRMREMLKSMEELKESNDNVLKIIRVIDNMAFQTNMLAINVMAESVRFVDDEAV